MFLAKKKKKKKKTEYLRNSFSAALVIRIMLFIVYTFLLCILG